MMPDYDAPRWKRCLCRLSFGQAFKALCWVFVICFNLHQLTTACQKPEPSAEGAAFASVPVDGWAYGETFEFVPTPGFADSDGTARIAVAVRHTDSYLYSNLWLELATPVAGTDSMRLDTLNIRLADNFGKWYGRGSGVSFVLSDTLPGRFVYDEEHPARLRHIMRVDTLHDIEQIGVVYFEPQSARKQNPSSGAVVIE